MFAKERVPRSFVWLNITQFLGAMNDNVFKLLVVFLLVTELGMNETTVVSTASIVFVVPFLLFSHAAGVLADRLSKRDIVVAAKGMEVAVMALGCVAVYFRQTWALYAILFLMCTQSAFFGPSKYGIIPELVPTEKLSKANSFLVGLSYLAIIIGTFIPSYLLLRWLDRDFMLLGYFCVGVAVLGLLASMRISRTPRAGAGGKFTLKFPLELWRTLMSLRSDKYLLLSVVAIGYYLFLGGFIQQNAIVYGKESLGLDWIASGYLFPVAALGIGLGAVLAGKMSGRNIEFGVVPIGAIGLTLCCIAFAFVPSELTGRAAWLGRLNDVPVLSLLKFTTKPVVWVLFLLGVSSGFFVVPLNAFIQYRSPAKRLGEILALSNFLSFVGVAVSAGVFYLLHGVLKLSTRHCFVVVGVLTGVLAVVTVRTLPDFLTRFVVVVVTKLFYRIDVHGLENLPLDGPALMVSNHVTWVDALLISAVQQRRIRFVMAREIAEYRPTRWLFRLMRVIPVSPKDPPRQIVASLQEARNALDEGYLVCIFAEGAITRTGNMRGFRPGLERIVKGTDYPIVPVYIGGAWGSIFSYFGGRLLSRLPRRIPYPTTLQIGRPMPATSSTSEVRTAVLELSGRYFDLRKAQRRTLGWQVINQARLHWGRQAAWDTTGKSVTSGRLLTGALVLKEVFAKLTAGQEMVGLLLPSCVGGAVSNVALTLMGKVPVNLNFTASREAIQSAVRQCEIKTVIASKKLIEKLPDFEVPEGTVYIEDLAAQVTGAAKLRALLKARFAPARSLGDFAERGPDDLATIVFSSGSTGEPKGVMLSHHNVISNIEACCQVYHFTHKDRMCAVLPFFHSFGFTVTLWCPLVRGFGVYYHPNPLDGATIATMARDNRLTLLLSTPTFLLAYIRRAKKEDFATLRLVVTGAEKLKTRVADSFEKKFAIRPLEGYGATELSPVAAVNVPNVTIDRVTHVGTKEQSVGHPIPGMTMKVVDPESAVELPEGEEGLLLAKGPNVMRGYLRKPEKTAEVLRDGWYSTGDIARIDKDGFVFLLDRMSRYSKIGGEMVPHLAIEEILIEALGTIGQCVFVTGAPDERKGEQLVVLYTPEAGDPDRLFAILKESDLPNLWKPRRENYFEIDELPQLGSGKLDLKAMRGLARDFVENR